MFASFRSRVQSSAFQTALWGTTLWLAAAGLVRGAAGPAAGLATNEVLVEVSLTVSSITAKGVVGGYGENWSVERDSTFSAAGRFAGTLAIPSPGKRALTLTRRLPGGLIGKCTENFNGDRLRIITEGGVNKEFKQTFTETWWHSEVDLPAMDWSIVFDLENSTWTCSRLFSSAQTALHHILENFNYTAIEVGPDTDGEVRTWASGDSTKPPPDMRGGPPRESVEAINILYGEFPKLETPRAYEVGNGYILGRATDGVGSVNSYRASYNFAWVIRTTPPELELRVTSPDLERWRPEAKPSDNPGDVRPNPGRALDLIAEVVDPAGTKPLVRIRKLRWWLEGTSRLPGFAMNLPYASSETSPDLEIDHPQATAEGQELVLNDLTTLRNKIRIKPYDWGAWSTLHVEAELDDGQKLTGKIKGPFGDETEIRLPARDPDSKVATVWKRQIHAQGMADDADEDGIPEGRRKGDGFTLFEEYRGFYAWELETARGSQPAVHHSTSPRGKTVFVYDRVGNKDTAEALRLFRNASEARVYALKPGYGVLDESRLMNRNVGDGPTKGPQHAIGIRYGAEFGPKNPGSPGGEEVRIRPLSAGEIANFPTRTPASLTTMFRRLIAVFLLTSCNVPRPGEGDKALGFSLVAGADGAPIVRTSEGRYVILRDEVTGLDLAEEWLRKSVQSGKTIGERTFTEPVEFFPRGLYVGVTGGRHSGPLDNIMRSAYSEAYEYEGTDTIFVLPNPSDEKLGYDLTPTSAGDGYNRGDQGRRKRYGDSPRPPSRTQFDVIDRAP